MTVHLPGVRMISEMEALTCIGLWKHITSLTLRADAYDKLAAELLESPDKRDAGLVGEDSIRMFQIVIRRGA